MSSSSSDTRIPLGSTTFEHEQDHHGDDERPHERGADREHLLAEQLAAAADRTRRRCHAELYAASANTPSEQRADDAADEVDADDVERVVVAELELQARPRA